ncbi:MAG: condensation domain-containing protein [Pseudomonadota bacterium]|nr:condensation domain-containing protein [Pseudomonadota bacterium]
MSFFRIPSPLEFTYIAADLPHYSPTVNQFFVIGKGDIDRDRLRSALAQAVAANPGFKLRLQGVWGWRRWVNGLDPTVEELDAPDWDSSTSEGAPLLGNPIDLRRESPCQIAKIRTPNGLHLLFRTHHAITDGRGTVHLMNEVFRILRGEAPLGSTSKLTEWDIAMREERPEWTVSPQHCLPVIKGTLNETLSGCHWNRFDWRGDKNKFAAKMIFACSQLAREHFGEGHVGFRIPADLRRYMTDEEGLTIANCSGAIDLDVSSDSTLNQIRSHIVRAMRQKMDLAPFKDNHKFVKWLPKSLFRTHPDSLRRLHKQQRYRGSGIISYLGEVNNDLFSCDGFEPFSQFGVPIPFENKPLYVAAVSYNDTTNIIIGCPRALCTMAELKTFCGELATKLDSL